jgi:hypothetical protein
MHIASPNAAEVIQGFALAMKKGLTYEVSLIVFSVALVRGGCELVIQGHVTLVTPRTGLCVSVYAVSSGSAHCCSVRWSLNHFVLFSVFRYLRRS